MTDFLPTIAKAIVAMIGVVTAAIVAGTLDVEPWVEVALTAISAGILVYLVPNKSTG